MLSSYIEKGIFKNSSHVLKYVNRVNFNNYKFINLYFSCMLKAPCCIKLFNDFFINVRSSEENLVNIFIIVTTKLR